MQNGRTRVAIIEGCRTPFAKAWTDLKALSAVDLAKVAVGELINRSEIPVEAIDEVMIGSVIPPSNAPNIAREVVLALGLPKTIPGFTVVRACASGIQAITSGAESIMAGQNEVVIAGGTESLSNVTVPHSPKLVAGLMDLQKAKSLPAKLSALRKISVADFLPKPPDIAEYSTGLSMGQHAEIMAKKNGISREEQDKLALASHHRAAAGFDDGRIPLELCTAYAPPKFAPVKADNGVRKDTSLDALGKLRPVFDKKYGTITAGNASPLTDGASAVLLMSEEKAKALGLKPKAYIRSWAYTALDPNDQLLLGPAYATPAALKRAGLSLSDIDIVDMHEAFAAQILSNLKALSSKKFAEEQLGRSEAVGEIDPAKFNVMGGSIAIGHPFGATGGRMVTTVTNELQRRNAQFGLVTICAAGGIGVGMVLERAEA